MLYKLIQKQSGNLKNDILSGLTVALALVPEAVAFAFVAGIDPLIGLYGAFMMGLITSVFGGRPGMISGATGAMAVVMVSLVKDGNQFGLTAGTAELGLQFLFVTLLLVGFIQILAGVFRLGKFVRLIPRPVMMGFVNGLAIVIFLSQLGMFQTNVKDIYGNNKKEVAPIAALYTVKENRVLDKLTATPVFTQVGDKLIDNQQQERYQIAGNQLFDLETKRVTFLWQDNSIYSIEVKGNQKEWIKGKKFYLMLALVLLTMLIMFGLPKITKKIPEALFAIVVVSLIGIIFFKEDITTVQAFLRDGLDKAAAANAGLKGGLPQFQTQLFHLNLLWSWEAIRIMLPYAFILAAIGLIESLMTLNLVDDLTETRGSGNRECIAQGSANVVNGLFGGMGGCAMIGQSIINIKSGGRGRLSGIVAALTLLAFILFASKYIEMIPIAALVGVMFMVVIGTFAWSSFRILHKIPLTDALTIVLVSVLTVFFDLAIAVIAGVIVSALVFSWENAKRIRARKSMKEDGTKVYEIWGPLFFGSITQFNSKFDVKNDPPMIQIDFIESKVSDHSGIEAIRAIVNKYEAEGKTVRLTHLSPDCQALLSKANKKFDELIEKQIDDPRYYVVSDNATPKISNYS